MALTRIPTIQITDNAVTTAKIDDATIIETDIVDGTITNAMVDASAAIAHTKLAVGTAAPLNVGTGANQILQLNGSGVLPALDGTQLTGIQTDFSPLENQIAKLGLHIGAVDQLTKYQMIDQVIDSYEDATGIVAYNGVAGVSAMGDSSSYARKVTASGNVAASTAQKKIGTHSIVFDGSGDKLEVAADAVFEVAPTDPYTIEFWFKMNDITTRKQFFGGGTWTSSGTPTSWVIDYQNNTNSNDQYIRWARYGTNASYTWGYAADTEWHHLAIVMPGDGTQKLYFDGTQQASASVGDTWHTSSDTVKIGMSGLSGQDMNGYMDEIRISDVARYSANFTPSTTAFTSDANTLLLIHGEAQAAVPNTGSSQGAEPQGIVGEKYCKGQPVEKYAITAVGDYSSSKSYKTGDRRSSITVTHSGLTVAGGTVNAMLDGVSNSYGNSAWFAAPVSAGAYLRFEFDSAKVIIENKWYQNTTHSGATWQWQGSNDATTWTNIGSPFQMICNVANQGTVNTQLNGNTTSYTYYQMLYVSGSNNANPYWQEIEFAEIGHTVTAVGNAAASTTEKKIGTSSIAFDGSGDYLQVPNLFALYDFTIELWMYNTESNSNAHIIGNCNHTTGSGGGWGIYCNGNGVLKFNSYGNSWNTGDTNIGWSTSTWHHVAVTRSGTTVKIWLDGVEKYSATKSAAILGGPTNLGIGADNGATSSMDFVGYMDEIRISNTARYTSAFTPSTTAFTSDAWTELLIHGEAQAAVPASDSMELFSTTTTANSAVTKADILIQTEDEIGTSTINTDIKAGVSRDALNYVETTLVNKGTWGTNKHILAANDVTIPGTVMTKIITVAASKLVTDGTSQATLTLTEGYTYKFDTSDSTMSGHTFSFATAADAAGSTQYTTGVTTNGTPGNAGAYTQIVVAASAPTLYYYCANHGSMGGTANTPAETSTTSMRYKIETKNQSYIAPFSDYSGSAHTVGVNGSVALSTTTKKIGTSSIYFTGGKLEIPSSTDFDFAGDFTIEYWINSTDTGTTSSSTNSRVMSRGDHPDEWFIRADSSSGVEAMKLQFGGTDDLNLHTGGTADTWADGTWHHFAVTRDGNTVRLYIDGTQIDTTTVSGAFDAGDGANLYIGNEDDNSEDFHGYLDEIRISNNCRYPSGTTFTPSTTAFTSDANTKLLIHGDGASGKVTRIHGTSLAWS